MSGAVQAQHLCPRCYAQLAAGAASCGRCGVAVGERLPGRRMAEPAREGGSLVCPRCDRLEAHGARFNGAVGSGSAGACPHCGTAMVEAAPDDRVAYEEVSLATDSWDLERLTRAEAVDGWTLIDTTVDPNAPDRLLAHFRRALRADDPRARQILGGDAAKEQAPTPVQAPMADPVGDFKAQVRAAKTAVKAARDAGRQARRSARRERRHSDWEVPAGAIAAVVLAVVGVGLTVGLAIIRLVVIPVLLALATVGREVIRSLLLGNLGPSLRRGRRRAGWNPRW